MSSNAQHARRRRGSNNSRGGRAGFGAKLLAVVVATLIAGGPLIRSARVEAEGDTGPGVTENGADSFNFAEQENAIHADGVDATSDNALRVHTAPVTNTGAFEHSVDIAVPPGRAGMSPSLSLSYTSDTHGQASPIGAGWSLPIPSIQRSSRDGFPIVEPDGDGGYVYDDKQTRFEGPTGRLARAPVTNDFPASPGATVYLPLREQSPVRYEYLPPPEDRWVEHLPSGSKRYYGQRPSGDEARVVNELGTHRWLLLEERDFNGNTIEYEYHNIEKEDRPDPRIPQTAPLLSEVRWGGNAVTGRSHRFFLNTSLAAQNAAVNFRQGHVQLDHRISRIDVEGPERETHEGRVRYWSYHLETSLSPETQRTLLDAVVFRAPDGNERRWSFDYSDNEGLTEPFGPEQGFPGAPEGLYQFLPNDGNWVRSKKDLLTPGGRARGYRFLDIDADGDTDIVYHPAGLLSQSSRVVSEDSYLQEYNAAGERVWIRASDVHTLEGITWRSLVSTLGDVDGDVDLDGVTFPLTLQWGRLEQETFHDNSYPSARVDDGSVGFHINPDTLEPWLEQVQDRCPEPLMPIPSRLPCFTDPWTDPDPVGPGTPWDFPVRDAQGGLRLAPVEDTAGPLFAPMVEPLLDPLPERESIYDPFEGQIVPMSGTYFRPTPIDPAAGPEILVTDGGLIFESDSVRSDLICGNVDIRMPTFREDLGADYDGHHGGVPPGAPGDSDELGDRRTEVKVAPNVERFGLADPPFATQLAHWPVGVERRLRACYAPKEADETGAFQLTVHRPSDFQAPVTDVNGDGRGDIVLLKATWFDAANGRTNAFVPRVWISDGQHFWFDGTDEPGVRARRDSAFTESLYDALVAPEETMYCPPGDTECGNPKRYPAALAYNSLFTDVNADGLVDLVVAEPPITTDFSDELCKPGHRIYLNRGYRFEEDSERPLSEGSWAPRDGSRDWTGNPWTRLYNRSGPCKGVEGMRDVDAAVRGDTLPTSAMSLVDINADGRQDLVFAARVFGGPTPETLVQDVYLNTPTGYRRVEWWDLRDYLPPGFVLSRELIDPGDHLINSRTNLSEDLGRFVDIDGDGLQDIVIGGQCRDAPSRPWFHDKFDCEPATWRRNLREIPDILTRVEEPDRGFVEVDYVAATTEEARANGVVTDPGQLPQGHLVVEEVRRASSPDDGPTPDGAASWGDFEAGHVERIELQYENFVRQRGSSAAVGFEMVNARFHNSYGGVEESPSFVTQSVYETRPNIDLSDGSDSPVAYPLKSQLRARVTTWGRTERTERFDYYLESLGTAVRVRSQGSIVTRCEDRDCYTTRDELDRFDEHGFPRESRSGPVDPTTEEVALGHRDAIRTVTTPVHFEDRWRLGLEGHSQTFGYAREIDGTVDPHGLLAVVDHSYDAATSRLRRRNVTLDDDGECADEADISFRLYEEYNDEGRPTQVIENRRILDFEYDDLGIYPARISTHNDDGDELAESATYDPRFGERSSRVDLNGHSWSQTYDSLGRPLVRQGPSGVVLQENVYTDPSDAPRYRDAIIHTDVGRSYTVRTYFDGEGREMASVEEVDPIGTIPGHTDRTSFVARDAWGRVRAEYLPRPASDLGDVSVDSPGELSTQTRYDGYDRVLRVTLPDGRERTTDYAVVGSGVDAAPQVTETDPADTSTATTMTTRGDPATVEHFGAAGTSLAVINYERDGLGRTVRVEDADGKVRELEHDLGGRLRHATLPHDASVDPEPHSYCFDADSQLSYAETAAGRQLTIQRDSLGRAFKVAGEYEGITTTRDIVYDKGRNGLGRAATVVDDSGTWKFGYDDFGRQSLLTYDMSSAVANRLPPELVSTYTVQYDYGLADQLKLLTWSLGDRYTQDLVIDHDGEARLSHLEAAGREIVRSTIYDEQDRLRHVSYGNNVQLDLGFEDATGYLRHIDFQDGRSFARVDYEVYDANDNLEFERRSIRGTEIVKAHDYDGLDRLTRSTIASSGRSGPVLEETYGYSPGGNLERAGTDSYSYDRRTNRQAATSVEEATGDVRQLRYDADGFMVVDHTRARGRGHDNRSLTFDAMGCLRDVKVQTLEPSGSRIRGSTRSICGFDGREIVRDTVVNGRRSRVVYLPGGLELRPDDNLMLYRLPLGGLTVAQVAWNLDTGEIDEAESGYTYTDLRGSVLAQTRLDVPDLRNSDLAAYGPWGRTLSMDAIDPRLAGVTPPRHQFTGEEPDRASRYYRFGARAYDPSLRRWLSPDPLFFVSPDSDPLKGLQLNLYSYAANSPIALKDANGLDVIALQFGGGFGAFFTALEGRVGVALQFGNGLPVQVAPFVQQAKGFGLDLGVNAVGGAAMNPGSFEDFGGKGAQLSIGGGETGKNVEVSAVVPENGSEPTISVEGGKAAGLPISATVSETNTEVGPRLTIAEGEQASGAGSRKSSQAAASAQRRSEDPNVRRERSAPGAAGQAGSSAGAAAGREQATGAAAAHAGARAGSAGSSESDVKVRPARGGLHGMAAAARTAAVRDRNLR